jgi:polysaccharide biosynthesis/export protein
MPLLRELLRSITLCLLAFLSLLLPRAVAQDATASTPSEEHPTLQVARDDDGVRSDGALRLGSGDLVEINVYNVPELTTKARISSDGDIYLPLINSVHVGGMTTEEAESLIQKRLSDGGFVKDPHVTVFVNESASQGASVLGEVTKPGVYRVAGEERVLDLISSAGGLTEKAGRSITVTHRNQPDRPITLPLSRNVNDNPDSNIAVYPGDTIIVRKADVVYVVGDVGRPSGFLMNGDHLTVLQAIALAGGTTRTANLGGARIIRKSSTGMTETPVELKKILQAKAPDLPMQADDILFVPTSAGKAFAGRTFEAAMQAATAVSIVAVQ